MILPSVISVISGTTALQFILLVSSFKIGTCNNETATPFVPVTSLDDVPVFVDGTIVPTKKHVVDPWVRPPRGVPRQEALGMPGDFDGYPKIVASPYDSIEFMMRPVNRVGDNTQRHGVYVITDKQLVQDYLNGVTEHPCGEPVYTDMNLCQVVEFQGLNATDCPSRETLFPLLEIFGASGVVPYTTSELGALADRYGVETESGSRILSFDCPWIQGRNDEGGGRTSHCIGGMFQIVEVLAKETVIANGTSPKAPAETSGSTPTWGASSSRIGTVTVATVAAAAVALWQ